jgi:hypothetical protein
MGLRNTPRSKSSTSHSEQGAYCTPALLVDPAATKGVRASSSQGSIAASARVGTNSASSTNPRSG